MTSAQARTMAVCAAIFSWSALRGADPPSGSSRPAPHSGGVVTITIRDSTSAPNPHLHIGDVADLEGGPAAVRERIAKLDLAELSCTVSEIQVRREQVLYRIRITDIDP